VSAEFDCLAPFAGVVGDPEFGGAGIGAVSSQAGSTEVDKCAGEGFGCGSASVGDDDGGCVGLAATMRARLHLQQVGG
jgi:hypothetical protein